MRKPEHWASGHLFMLFLVDCAISDRTAYLQAIRQTGFEREEKETMAEIAAFRDHRRQIIRTEERRALKRNSSTS